MTDLQGTTPPSQRTRIPSFVASTLAAKSHPLPNVHGAQLRTTAPPRFDPSAGVSMPDETRDRVGRAVARQLQRLVGQHALACACVFQDPYFSFELASAAPLRSYAPNISGSRPFRSNRPFSAMLAICGPSSVMLTHAM